MKFLRRFFKLHHKYTFLMKSGNKFSVWAKDCEITYRTESGEASGYQIYNILGRGPLYLNITQIEAVLK